MKQSPASFNRATLLLLLLSTVCLTSIAQTSAGQKENEISMRQLQSVDIDSFASAGTTVPVDSSTVVLLVNDKVTYYHLQAGNIPAELKTSLAKAAAGDIISVTDRFVTIDGIRKKVPAILYYVVKE